MRSAGVLPPGCLGDVKKKAMRWSGSKRRPQTSEPDGSARFTGGRSLPRGHPTSVPTTSVVLGGNKNGMAKEVMLEPVVVVNPVNTAKKKKRTTRGVEEGERSAHCPVAA